MINNIISISVSITYMSVLITLSAGNMTSCVTSCSSAYHIPLPTTSLNATVLHTRASSRTIMGAAAAAAVVFDSSARVLLARDT